MRNASELITEGGFMKADIVLVNRNKITNQIDDVVIIENKLSEFTDYTVRQKEGWKKLANGEDIILKRGVEGINSEGKSITLDNNLPISNDIIKTIKISDHGKSNINKIDFERITVNNYKNYVHKPKK